MAELIVVRNAAHLGHRSPAHLPFYLGISPNNHLFPALYRRSFRFLFRVSDNIILADCCCLLMSAAGSDGPLINNAQDEQSDDAQRQSEEKYRKHDAGNHREHDYSKLRSARGPTPNKNRRARPSFRSLFLAENPRQ
jgi:hypothetical protein